MDKIEERLRRLLGWQHQVVRMETGALPDHDLASSYKYRDAHRDAIAADWREMVMALEKYEMAEQCADKHGVAAVMTIELLTEAYEAGHTVLARVKGE